MTTYESALHAEARSANMLVRGRNGRPDERDERMQPLEMKWGLTAAETREMQLHSINWEALTTEDLKATIQNERYRDPVLCECAQDEHVRRFGKRWPH